MNRLIYLILIFISLTNNADAKDYKVELLIFENNNADNSSESNQYHPPEKMHSAASTWPIDAQMLLNEKQSIEMSAEYQVIKHLAWGQQALPYSRSAAVEINDQQVSGWAKVYAGELLFANLDLQVNGYRMKEKRRIKLNQKHYFDHPKFGVLIQVSRLQKPNIDVSKKPVAEPTLQSKK